MFIDKQNTFSDKQSLINGIGSFLSTNVMDLFRGQTANPTAFGGSGGGGVVLNDIGRGNPPELLAQLTEDVTSGGAATVEVQLVSADDAALTTNLTVLQTSGALPLSVLKAGYQARLATPAGITQRFLGMRYVVAVAATTGGKIFSGFVKAKQTAIRTMS
jgi:hypothetical protein